MPPRCSLLPGTLTPFLYPFLLPIPGTVSRPIFNAFRRRSQSTLSQSNEEGSHLNPSSTDYSRSVFADKAIVTIYAGSGGHGCISFLKEKYIAAGPANGGDGGSGGGVYIQAVRGETSLHKLARRNTIKAGRGKNGQGKTRGGERGEDVVITVPVGTIVREIERTDFAAEEEEKRMLEAGGSGPYKWDKDKWLLYPATTKEDIATAEFPALPRGRKSPLAMAQAKAPISLDLNIPMDRPILLAAGAVGGLGNPHFVSRTALRPKFASKGDPGMVIMLELELKLLADVGLVGLPNAGKSTLLRAMSRSRARVGDWAFTTLQPNIGTVVLDNHKDRPLAKAAYETGESRTNFTIADIPGLIRGAHLDKGLGISFLRHVERARMLAFVVDLGAGNAVEALKGLWNEVGLYESMKIQERKDSSEVVVQWSPFTSVKDALSNRSETIVIPSGPDFEAPFTPQATSIAGKPWFVVATKADLPGTKENFENLTKYLADVKDGNERHPSGQKEYWTSKVEAIPVSAINGQGVKKIMDWVVRLLDE